MTDTTLINLIQNYSNEKLQNSFQWKSRDLPQQNNQ